MADVIVHVSMHDCTERRPGPLPARHQIVSHCFWDISIGIQSVEPVGHSAIQLFPFTTSMTHVYLPDVESYCKVFAAQFWPPDSSRKKNTSAPLVRMFMQINNISYPVNKKSPAAKL